MYKKQLLRGPPNGGTDAGRRRLRPDALSLDDAIYKALTGHNYSYQRRYVQKRINQATMQ
jgi:hypothetical protein